MAKWTNHFFWQTVSKGQISMILPLKMANGNHGANDL